MASLHESPEILEELQGEQRGGVPPAPFPGVGILPLDAIEVPPVAEEFQKPARNAELSGSLSTSRRNSSLLIVTLFLLRCTDGNRSQDGYSKLHNFVETADVQTPRTAPPKLNPKPAKIRDPILDELLPWNAPKREGFTRRRLAMKELAWKRRHVQ